MNCEKAESNMVKKPKNRNILVAPNRNHAKKKKIKPSISNDNKNKKYKFDKKQIVNRVARKIQIGTTYRF